MTDRDKRDKVLWILTKENLSQTWLINQLVKRGHDVTKTNLSDVLRGVRRTDTALEILDKCLSILESYERWSAGN